MSLNLKQVLNILETSLVSGVTAGVGVLSTDSAHLNLKVLAAAGVATLGGFLYQLNREIGVAEGQASVVTKAVAVASKVVIADVAPPPASTTVLTTEPVNTGA